MALQHNQRRDAHLHVALAIPRARSNHTCNPLSVSHARSPAASRFGVFACATHLLGVVTEHAVQKRRFLPRRERRRDGQGRGLDSRQCRRRRPRPQGAAQAIDRLCTVCTFIRFEAHALPFISPLAVAPSPFLIL